MFAEVPLFTGLLLVSFFAVFLFAWIWFVTKERKIALLVVVVSVLVGLVALYADHVLRCETFHPTECKYWRSK